MASGPSSVGLAAGAVAMIRRVLRLGAARRIDKVVGQLAAERTLHDRFLEATDDGLELLDGERPLAHKLIEISEGTGVSGVSGARLFRSGAA